MFITAGVNEGLRVSNSYQEALIGALVARGHKVSVLCTACVDALPTLHFRMSGENPRFIKVYNAGVYPALYSEGGVGTREPVRDMRGAAKLQCIVLSAVETAKPDVISFQSLYGLPFDIVEAINRIGIRTVLTLHDYFSICPTSHLYMPDGARCRGTASELTCYRCCGASLSYRVFWSSLQLTRAATFFSDGALRKVLYRLRNVIQRTLNARVMDADKQPDFSRRRSAAISMLSSFSVLQCISRSQAKILAGIVGNLNNIEIHPLVPPGVSKRSPARSSGKSERVRFVALNVHARYKGSQLLQTVFQKLWEEKIPFQLDVYGPVPEDKLICPSVIYHGRYSEGELDAIAAQSDFCIVPSLCDETLGFVGVEMLSRGVPLIVSDRAGVSEYVDVGVTGYVFDPEREEVLWLLLKQLALSVDAARATSKKLVENPPPVEIFSTHVEKMEALFFGSSSSPQL